MAMTLSPPSPSSGSSPATPDTEVPQTPLSPNPQQDSQQNNQQANSPTSPTGNNSASAQVKRKPSRRANTAERRATHNAVERQRRETLNGRFLDLAALLPNLSQIRRPSKSSIVNSSIAHIQASRRHRMLAARELRLLKHESDALRRELNEWRDRAGIPRVEEPLRGDAFSMVLSGELEVIAAVPGEEEGEEDNDYLGYPDEDYPGMMPAQPMQQQQPSHHSAVNHAQLDESEDSRMASIIKSGHSFPQNMSAAQGNNLHLAHILPRPSAAGNPSMLAASPTFESPGMYDSHHTFAGMPQHQQQSIDADKMAAWYGAQSQQQQHMLQAQRSLFTPPASSHGNVNGGNGNNVHNGSASPVNGNLSSNSPSPVTSGSPFNDPTFFARQQQQQGYNSDDGSVGSVGSNGKRISIPGSVPINISGRARALSAASHGAHSVGMSGSPGGASPISAGAGSPTYEIDNNPFGRRPGPGPTTWRDEVSAAQHAHGSLMGMVGMSNGMMMSGLGLGMGNGLVGSNMGAMVPVGGPGGGSGGGFAMMM